MDRIDCWPRIDSFAWKLWKRTNLSWLIRVGGNSTLVNSHQVALLHDPGREELLLVHAGQRPVLGGARGLDHGEGQDDEDDDGDEPRHDQALDVHLQPAVVLPFNATGKRWLLCNLMISSSTGWPASFFFTDTAYGIWLDWLGMVGLTLILPFLFGLLGIGRNGWAPRR